MEPVGQQQPNLGPQRLGTFRRDEMEGEYSHPLAQAAGTLPQSQP